jgi:hypothetical protein
MLPEDTPTRRRRVFVNAVVDADGRVRLELPVGMDLANVLRTFTVEFDEPLPTVEALGHPHDFVHPTAGSIPDFPLDADEGFVWEEEEETVESPDKNNDPT